MGSSLGGIDIDRAADHDISDDERTFFAGLGERVAQLRKHMQRISRRLPEPKQRAVMDVIEAMLAQQRPP